NWGGLGYTGCRRYGRSAPPPFGGNRRGMATSEPVPLLLEGVGVVVVPVALPESGAIVRRELDPAKPFRALPEVLTRDHEAQRAAVLGSQRLAVRVRGEERERIAQERDRHVCGVALLGMRDDEVRGRLRPDELLERAPVDSFERDVEAAP